MTTEHPEPLQHGELAYSWPALLFAIVVLIVLPLHVAGFGWATPLGLALVAAILPACLIRDWWVAR